MSRKTFWTSFLDGFTGEGIVGNLLSPGAPTSLFNSEAQTDTILELHIKPGAKVPVEEIVGLRAAVQQVVNETAGGRVLVVVPDIAERDKVT